MDELLKSFLAGFPDSTHPLDRERFVAYAISCIEKGEYIDVESIQKHGLSNERIDELEIAFGWIKDTMDYLSNRETL